MPEEFIIHKLDLLRQFHIVKSRPDGGSMHYASAFLASRASLTDAFGPPSVAPPVTRHPEATLGSLGEFETCPDWVPSLDCRAGLAQMQLPYGHLKRLERPPFYAAEVRTASSVGSQQKSPSQIFRLRATPVRHSNSRRIRADIHGQQI